MPQNRSFSSVHTTSGGFARLMPENGISANKELVTQRRISPTTKTEGESKSIYELYRHAFGSQGVDARICIFFLVSPSSPSFLAQISEFSGFHVFHFIALGICWRVRFIRHGIPWRVRFIAHGIAHGIRKGESHPPVSSFRFHDFASTILRVAGKELADALDHYRP